MIKFLLQSIRTGNVIRSLAGYLEARVKLLKLDIRNEISGSLALAGFLLLVALVAFLFLIFISLAIAEGINKAYGHSYMGPAIVATCYLLLLIILLLARKKIRSYFRRMFKSHVGEPHIDDE